MIGAFGKPWVLRMCGRRLRRGWRQGELLILALAVAVAVAAATAVGTFSSRVRMAINLQSGEAMGADLLVRSRNPIPADIVERARELGLKRSHLVNLPTVIFHGDHQALAGLKAADPHYPLRGQLRTSETAYGSEREVETGPAPGEAWADPRLWSELRLAAGAEIEIGATTLTVTRLLTYEPDRGAGFTDLAPRLLINRDDLPATRLLLPGSRAWHTLMLSGDPDALDAFRAQPLPPGISLRGPEEARPEIRSALDRAEAFLDLAALAATLLAAAAIALCARQHGLRQRDEVALLRCLGANRSEIFAGMLLSLLAIGIVAAVLGAMVGFAAQFMLEQLARALLTSTLPAAPLMPAFSAIALGLLLLLGFALPPIIDARDTPPIRVFQRAASSPGRSLLLPIGCAAAVVAGLLLESNNARLSTFTLLGIGISAAALTGVAMLLIHLLKPLRERGGSAWRLGLGNVSRRRLATIAQSVALGLGLLALLLLSFVHGDLLEGWQERLPPDTPNQFLINIQSDQVEPLRQFLRDRGLEQAEIWPMTRGRLVALNGEAVNADSFDDPDTQRWINRDFNLSWAAEMQAGNTLTEGEWWSEADHGKPWMSAEEYARERLGVKIGDELTLDFAGRRLTFEIRNFREVDWETFQPNFFLVTTPGSIADTPTTWLTSFYLPAEKRTLLRELITTWPNITALDLEAMMNQVRTIITRISNALEFVFLFTLAAGFAVLLAAIEATRDERVREVGLLRALGASRRRVAISLITEYAVLGLLAGSVAAVSAQLIGSVIAHEVLEMAYGVQPVLFLAGSIGGALLVAGLGWLSLWPVTRTPPHVVLRG